ncbi:protein adenylyltransferase SelO family protein [Pseudoalteromonas citrea]
MTFVKRYENISDQFSVVSRPKVSMMPELLLWNDDLVTQLAIPLVANEAAELLSGNRVLPDVEPVALAYSGHQFGHFNPTLGDGRAHLLGAFTDPQGQLLDIQLKGSGRTPFSRGGDGLCALGPAVREYVMSRAMAALGVPTTHCLAVVTTGDSVFREQAVAGAVVSRIASSHIRVGSFQYLALNDDKHGMRELMEHAIASHYPHITETGDARTVAFLSAVCEKQIELIIQWLRVGFIHGVMNTDNTLVSGETIDYGPCAMLEAFDFNQVYSSIDKQGRYAFGNQPNIANWNCARLAESLLTIMESEEDTALNMLTTAIGTFSDKFNQAYKAMWANKLGILEWRESDSELLSELLTLMNEHKLDYTNTFAALTNSIMAKPSNLFIVHEVIAGWYKKWQLRIAEAECTDIAKIMSRVNPAVVPRNQLVEQVIEQFMEVGSSDFLTQWLPVLNDPYNYEQQTSAFIEPLPSGANYHTFCGT